ncbi:zinc finger and SCAN domain-containing protein 20 isoform X2 [Solenopsis invicta]|uniref:zinc finger and SCAN domain-containing protein 20 isoform X2 n=1 Tax=Solenopsis invicta TaxID=13686 RepID=UPI00193DEFC8|nr:zinc finger and SCAN domain-containing protein 20 isoform X2 [Solenopsis invicta]
MSSSCENKSAIINIMCKKGLNWGEEETRVFLELCTEKQILSIMNGKRHKHVEIFRLLVPEMEQRGYNKTAEQMKLKLKNLKLAYFKCKRDNNVSGAATTRCPFYDEMEILYGCRPNAAASSCNSGIDTAISNINDNISNVIENEHDNIDNDNGGADNNGSSDGNDKAHSSNSTDNILPVEVNLEENEEPAKKRRKTKQKSVTRLL